MIIGYLGIGTVVGVTAAAFSLFMGFSAASALGFYVVVGACTVFVMAALGAFKKGREADAQSSDAKMMP